MEDIIGYARVFARIKVEQEVHKPFLRRPYLKYGQCYLIWSYFFQLGGILGAKHSAQPDAFGHAFLGAQGPPGAVKKFFAELAISLVKDRVSDSMSFWDYAHAEIMKRMSFAGNATSFFVKYAPKHLRPDTAEELAYQFSRRGSALGATYPDAIRRMFDHSHSAAPKEDWELAHDAGLDIPPEQDLMTYEETEKEENEFFMAYCRGCSPELHSILSVTSGRVTGQH